MKSFLKYWLPVILWMTLIFTASADSKSYQHSSTLFEPFLRWLLPHLPQTRIETIHHFFRKCGHFAEYGILALLIWRAIRQPQKNDPRPWLGKHVALTLGIVFLYASSDEFHQIFVPTRTPLFTDVLIDTAGGATALLILFSIRAFVRRFLSRT